MDTQEKRGRKPRSTQESQQQPKETGYKPKPGEENDIHVEIEKKSFNASTGEKESTPYNQIFDLSAWRLFQTHGPTQGYWVNRVLYAPKGVDTNYLNPDPKALQKAAVEKKIADAQALLEQAEKLRASLK